MSVKLTVNNIGPLRKAEAELKPLTLFVGPNNSGKSTLATLLYAALVAVPGHAPIGIPRDNFRVALRGKRGDLDWSGRGTLIPRDKSEFSKLQQEVRAFSMAVIESEGSAVHVSERLRAFLGGCVDVALRAYAGGLARQVEYAFGEDFATLARVSGRRRRMPAKLVVENSAPGWRVEVRPSGLSISQPSGDAFVGWLTGRPRRPRGAASAWVRMVDLAEVDHRTSWRWRAMEWFLDMANDFLFDDFWYSVSYLPAARSGFLQSHRLLASALVSRSSRVGIEDFGVSRLTGVVSDFISQLLELSPDTKRHGFDDVADELERTVLGGEVRISEGPASYPEISYRTGDTSLPLHRTSSMVSELAPVVLYLRHVLRSGDMLIVEEPEAHLHPESQIILANTVARLVSEGLRVVLTTHSDYFLQQVNNTIMASALGPDARARDEVLALPKLSADQVAAYVFRFDGQSGTTTRELPVKPHEGGVSDQDFAEVTEAQYDQAVEIDRRLIDAG